MVTINGIDPMVLDRIKERTQKNVIFETEKTKVTADKNEEQKERRRGKHYNKSALEKAVNALNKIFEEENLPFFFQIIARDKKLKVLLLDIEKNKVLSEVFPEKIYELLRRPDKYSGLVLDESV